MDGLLLLLGLLLPQGLKLLPLPLLLCLPTSLLLLQDLLLVLQTHTQHLYFWPHNLQMLNQWQFLQHYEQSGGSTVINEEKSIKQ
jgi:hypothetical protein